MKKKPFVTKEQLEEIVKKYPTPFHLYDEKGIRENAKAHFPQFGIRLLLYIQRIVKDCLSGQMVSRKHQ